MVNKRNPTTALFLSILLAACGGGGGSENTATGFSGAGTASVGTSGGAATPSPTGRTDGPVANPGDGGTGVPPPATPPPDRITAWTVTDLSVVLAANARPVDINNQGEIVGAIRVSTSSSGAEPQDHAFVYRKGKISSLGSLGGAYTQANAINNKGEIAGHGTLVVNGKTVVHGYVHRNGVMQDMKLSEGSFYFYDMNDAGEIVGNFNDRTPFIFSNGQARTLGNLPGSSSSDARIINASGKILGTSENIGDLSSVRTFLYSSGELQDLSSGAGCRSSSYQALNDTDQLAGLCDGKLVIRSGSAIKQLGSIPGSERTEVIDMNNSGQVVGNFYVTGSNLSRMFFYDGAELINLGEESSIAAGGWKLFRAKAMNDSGQIIATGYRNNLSDLRYLLLTPVKN